MQNTPSPLASFHPAGRAIIGAEDHEAPPHFEITEKMKTVLNMGGVPRHKLSADGSSVEPALTPNTDQTAHNLLVTKTALMFRPSLTRDQVFDLETKIYHLENGDACS